MTHDPSISSDVPSSSHTPNTDTTSTNTPSSTTTHTIPNFRSQYYFQLGLKSIAVPQPTEKDAMQEGLTGGMPLSANTTETRASISRGASQSDLTSMPNETTQSSHKSSQQTQWPHLLLHTPLTHLQSLLSNQCNPSSPIPPVPLNFIGRVLLRLISHSAGWGRVDAPAQLLAWLSMVGAGDWDKWLLRDVSGGHGFTSRNTSTDSLSDAAEYPHATSPRLTPQQTQNIETLTEEYIDDTVLIDLWKSYRIEEYQEKKRRRELRKLKQQQQAEGTADSTVPTPSTQSTSPKHHQPTQHPLSIVLKVWAHQIDTWELSLEAVEYRGWTARGRYLLEAFDSIERVQRLSNFKKEPRAVNKWYNAWQHVIDTLRRTELKHDFLMYQCFTGMMLQCVEKDYFMLGHWEEQIAKMVQELCVLCSTALDEVFSHLKQISSTEAYRVSECRRLLPSVWHSASDVGGASQLTPEQRLMEELHPRILAVWINWFASIFSSLLPPEATLRLWSVIFCRNPVDLMPSVALGIIALMRPQISVCTSMDSLESTLESFLLKERKVDQVVQQSFAYFQQRFSLSEVFLSNKKRASETSKLGMRDVVTKTKSKSPVARIRRSSLFSRSPPASNHA